MDSGTTETNNDFYKNSVIANNGSVDRWTENNEENTKSDRKNYNLKGFYILHQVSQKEDIWNVSRVRTETLTPGLVIIDSRLQGGARVCRVFMSNKMGFNS